MPMTIIFCRSGAADRSAVLALLAEARGDDLNAAERARRGFVQGQMDESILARFQTGSGVFVARDGETLAGVAMTSLPGMVDGGPPGRMVEEVTLARPDVPRERLFLYGPLAVDRRYQGRGLLTRLLIHACGELAEGFELGAAFVENSNQKSLAIHRHYPMDESAQFTINDRAYTVFTFAPKQVLAYYKQQGNHE